LQDRFDNYGIISCVILKLDDRDCFIDTWVMSCRVLKRQVENLMFDLVVNQAKQYECQYIKGEYIPTEKNKMVSNLLDNFGFSFIEEDGIKKYSLSLTKFHKNKNIYIRQIGV
jgi:FkbH-like protein